MGLDLFAKQVLATYDSLLKVGDNDTLTGTPKRISDGRGNDSPIWMGTTRIGIGLSPESGVDLQTNIGKFGSVITTSLRIDGSLTDSLGSIGSENQVLISTGSATRWASISAVSGVSGTGTTNTIPLWTSGTSIGNSLITQSVSTIDINGKLYADLIQLSGGTGDQATLSWNADEETIDIIQNGATLQVGQEVQIHCKNQTGSTIPNGTPVYVTGTLGASGRLTIAPMIADGSIPAKFFIGVTTEAILNGDDGKVTTFGKIRGLNTSAYTEGQTLWVSATNAGLFQTTEPIAPDLKLEIGIVINSSVNNGTIFVRSTIGHYISQAHDVEVISPTNKDLLVYDSTMGSWVNSKTIGDLSAANVTLSGYLRGPATFVIDPAAYGDETGLVQILGDLRVDGTTTTINSTTISVSDKNITLAKDAATAGDANGAGITIAGANATLTYFSATDDFTFNKNVNASRFVGPLTGNVTGTVSTLSNHDTDDLDEGTTNLYFTTARARAAFSAGTGVSIASGVISIGQSVGTTDDVTFGIVTASLSGNATTASALATARNIAIDGSVTGNADFDGSGNITITTTTNHNHDDRYYTETEVGNFFSGTTAITGYNKTNWDSAYSYSQIGHLPLTGGTLTGDLTLHDKLTITGTTNNFVIDEEADGTWHLYDTFQDNGIVLYSGSGGMDFQYNGVTEMTIDGAGVSFTGTINLDAADLNIGSADIIFGTTAGGATRGLIWDVSGSGNLSKLIGGGADGGKVTLFANMDDAITTGNIFEIKDGSTGSLFLGLSHAGILTAGGGTSTQWNTAYNYSQVGHLPLAGGTLTGALTTGRVTISNNVSAGGFTSFDDYQILLYQSSTGFTQSYGIGIEGDTMMFNSDDRYRFYVDNVVKATIESNGSLTLTGGITASGYNNTNWDTAYTYSQVGHLPLAGGQVTGTLKVGNTAGSWGSAFIGTSSTAGWGTGAYPFIGSNGGSEGSLIMLQNPHVPFRTDNAASASYDGRAGIRCATNEAGTGWWDIGLAGDFFHLYKTGTGELFRVANNGNVTATGTITAPTFSGALSGNASTATTATTANNALALSGYALDGATSVATRIFNNKGQVHGTYTDFNTAMTPGPNYLQGGTNSPSGVVNSQWYGFLLGLGSEYNTETGNANGYASQLYWSRQGTASPTPYLWARDMEGGTWGSWRKMSAGYADTAGSALVADVASTANYATTAGTASNADYASNSNLLDSLDSTQFLRSDEADVMSGDGAANNFRGVLRINNTGGSKWAGIAFPDDVNAADSSKNNYYFIGRSNLISNRTMSFHIPTGGDYESGIQPKFLFASTGGDELMTIQATTGNVFVKGSLGVGVSSPLQKIDVNGNISLGSWTKPGSTYVGLRRNDDGSFGGAGDSGLVIESYNHASPYAGDYSQRIHLRTHLYNGGSNNVLTAYGFNVGIGTNTPAYKLDVSGDARATGNLISDYRLMLPNMTIGYWDATYNRIESGSSRPLFITAYSQPIYMGRNGSIGDFTLHTSGRIGIGLTNPGRKLHLTGGDFYTADKSDTVGASVGYGGSSFQIRNGSTSEDLNFDIYNRTTFAWYTPTKITNKGTLLHGDTAVPGESVWKGTAVFGQSGTDKVITGYLTSGTNGAIIGGHNSALNAWGPLAIAGSELRFNYGETRVMTMTNIGLGIGTATPAAKLEVSFNGENGSGGLSGYGIATTASSGQATIGSVHSGDGYANLNLASNVGGLKMWHISKRLAADSHKLEYYYYDGGFTSKFEFLTNGNFIASNDVVANNLQLQLNGSIKKIGSGSTMKIINSNSITEMFVNGSGNLGIGIQNNTALAKVHVGGTFDGGYTSDASVGPMLVHNSSTATSSFGIKVKLDAGTFGAALAFWQGSTLRGYIGLSSGGTSYSTSSDYRLKENVVTLDNATERVMQLKPKRFNFIDGDGVVVDGFLAHEVQEVIPVAVQGEKDGVDHQGNPIYQGIDHSKLVPLLTASLQEALKRIEILEEKINNLNK